MPNQRTMTENKETFLSCSSIEELFARPGWPNLRELLISGPEVKDLSALAQLPNLERLHLSDTCVEDLSFVSRLAQLRNLKIVNVQNETKFRDLSPLAQVPDLEQLTLNGQKDLEFSVLATCMNLEVLDLPRNQLGDLSFAAQLKRLKYLNVGSSYPPWNSLVDWSPLEGLDRLEYLNLDKNPVSELSPIAGSSKLVHLNLCDTHVQYPSGFDLEIVAQDFAQSIEGMRQELGFQQIAIVAHSMGGLVSRRALCILNQSRSPLRIPTFVSVASPFGGVESARQGARMPFAIPAWRNLVPDSDFLVGLFEDPMSEETQHHLIYAQIEGQETDGTIPLSSQLSLPAQFNSFQTTRVEASHTGVLRNQRTYVLIADSLAQVVQSIPKR